MIRKAGPIPDAFKGGSIKKNEEKNGEKITDFSEKNFISLQCSEAAHRGAVCHKPYEKTVRLSHERHRSMNSAAAIIAAMLMSDFNK